jgi:hypothetical protein
VIGALYEEGPAARDSGKAAGKCQTPTGGREVEMYRKLAGTIAAVALVAAVALPGNLFAQSGATAADIRTEEKISVHVDNGHWLDVRVYAVRENGARDRIGTVTSFTSSKLELPRWMTSSISQVQLVAVPIGSTQRYAAQPVLVSIGDTIEWKLMNNLALSSIWVRTD